MAKSKSIRVLLFRTGQTEWERAGRIAGAADVPLSLSGFDANRRNIEQLDRPRLSVVLCGTDEASLTTARELAEAGEARVKPVETLNEVHLGLWEGLLESELEEKCPRTYRQWREDPDSVQVPEGETLEAAQERIMGGIGRSLSRARADNGAVAIVLRPMAMALVDCALSGEPAGRIWSVMEERPPVQWHTVRRDIHKPDPARAGA